MAELYLLIHEFDGECRTYPLYIRKPPNPDEITAGFLEKLVEQLGVRYDPSYHRLRLTGSYRPDQIQIVDSVTAPQFEEPTVAEFTVTVPTYYGDHDPYPPGKDEWDAPHVPVLVREADGLRIVLGSHDLNNSDAPDIYVERRPNGWAFFLHPEGGNDAAGFVYFLDDSDKAYVQPEWGNRLEWVEPASDVIARLKRLPAPADALPDLYDEITAKAERHGNTEGNEPQIDDLEEALKLSLSHLSEKQIQAVRKELTQADGFFTHYTAD